jgi:hypothetical protein
MKIILKYKKTIAATATGLILGSLFLSYPAPADRIINIQNYLITVGGIISAFVIAYLSAKIFNIRAEREARQRKIDKHSEKITDFRRLVYYIMKSREFWVRYDDIPKFRKKYPGLTYEMLHDQRVTHEYSTAVWNEEELSCNTIDLYCAMMAIYGDPEDFKDNAWPLDKFATFNYSIDDLRRFYDPSNQIWYYLSGRFAKHGQGRFNDTGVNVIWKPYVEQLLPKINPKYKGAEFHREILADIGSEIYELIPVVIRLIRHNTGVPQIVLKTFYSLIAIMTFGVVFPIAIQSMSISAKLNTAFTLSCVALTIIAMVVFMLDFLDFINDDVHIVKPTQTT